MNHDEMKVRAELSRDEKLIWTGRPYQGLIVRAVDGFLIPFSLIWGGFAIFWEGAAFISGAPAFFLLFGSAFVIIGLYLIFGRFIHDMLRRRHVIYGLTDKRAVFISKSGIQSVFLGEARDLHYKPHKGGLGTLQFGKGPSIFSMTLNQQMGLWTGLPTVPTFEKIKDGDRVYKEVKRLIGL